MKSNKELRNFFQDLVDSGELEAKEVNISKGDQGDKIVRLDTLVDLKGSRYIFLTNEDRDTYNLYFHEWGSDVGQLDYNECFLEKLGSNFDLDLVEKKNGYHLMGAYPIGVKIPERMVAERLMIHNESDFDIFKENLFQGTSKEYQKSRVSITDQNESLFKKVLAFYNK